MEHRFVRLDITDNVATLTLNRPEKLNAVSLEVFLECQGILAALRGREDVRALILTGAGRAFCAGADFGSFDNALAGDAAKLSPGQALSRRMEKGANPFLLQVRAFPKPVVCAVNGLAVGGGVGLALIGDVVVASRDASFALPQVGKLGLVPDLGASWLLPRLIGPARAASVMVLGEPVSAETAQQWGMISKCAAPEDLMTEAMRIARRLAALPCQAFLRTRALIEASGANTLAEQLHAEADGQRELSETPYFAEAVRAFIESKKPR